MLLMPVDEHVHAVGNGRVHHLAQARSGWTGGVQISTFWFHRNRRTKQGALPIRHQPVDNLFGEIALATPHGPEQAHPDQLNRRASLAYDLVPGCAERTVVFHWRVSQRGLRCADPARGTSGKCDDQSTQTSSGHSILHGRRSLQLRTETIVHAGRLPQPGGLRRLDLLPRG